MHAAATKGTDTPTTIHQQAAHHDAIGRPATAMMCFAPAAERP
eukprot:COSAG01_NODE_51729_length_352_cov_1.118577_1_plen_42_part_10